MNQLTAHGVLDEFPELFRSGGLMKNGKVTLNIDPNVPAKFCKARSLPYALRSKVEEELERLEKDGTIVSVKSSRWASQIVPVVKDDWSVRICVK